MDPSMGVGPTVLASLANFAAHVQHISPLRPDLYGEGGSLTDLEDDFARVLGKDACVTVLTGTLAHVVATRVHADDCQNVGRVALHATSSLLLSDLRPLENAWGFSPAVYGRAHRCASFADVSAVLSHKLKVATVILEVPQWATGGTVTPMEELEAIAVLCRHKRVRLHLDGSRLMHALPALGLSSAAEICCLFDSVYLSARDNFGALGGGFLAGTRRFVENARLWIKRLGACPPTLLPYEASIRKAVMRAEISPRSFHNRASRLRDACALITSQLIMRGAPIRLDPPVPQTTVVHVYLRGYTEEVKDAISRAEAASGVRLSGAIRSVPHYKLEPERLFAATPPEDIFLGDGNTVSDSPSFRDTGEDGAGAGSGTQPGQLPGAPAGAGAAAGALGDGRVRDDGSGMALQHGMMHGQAAGAVGPHAMQGPVPLGPDGQPLSIRVRSGPREGEEAYFEWELQHDDVSLSAEQLLGVWRIFCDILDEASVAPTVQAAGPPQVDGFAAGGFMDGGAGRVQAAQLPVSGGRLRPPRCLLPTRATTTHRAPPPSACGFGPKAM
ncbi:hypothetical protein FNF27_02366 [Cafeteria roenbergensis]|uniref:Aromatic amino acid beta-eliminating lyase/threonine aldolase domain-containing protein n=1 Tax=Cafeteria roenbergensis TaxID=33653 RepID=A0A5A8EK65_CAFRO|nr:hypothetical protein FNF27_02366 [Cafeteria roenbergensis]